MHEYIRQFEISMHDFMFAECFESIEYLYEEFDGLFLTKSLLFL